MDLFLKLFQVAALLVVGILLILLLAYGALVIYADRRWSAAVEEASRVVWESVERGEIGGGYEKIRLRGANGEEAIGLLRTGGSAGEARVAFLLLGGVGTGKNAAKLIEPLPGSLLVAFDYPLKDRLPRDDLWSKALALPVLVDGAAESLTSFTLALRYLESRPGIEKIILVGVSLGVPYAAVLAAENRVDGVALLYGGGDVGRIAGCALPLELRSVRSLLGRALGRLIAPVDPLRHVGKVSPAPLLLVNAKNDPRIPEACAEALVRAAGAPTKVVELGEGHVLPQKQELLRRAREEVRIWFSELSTVNGSGRLDD